MAIADLPHPLEVPVGRHQTATGVLHGLEVDGGDGLRPLGDDHRLDRVGAGERVVGIGSLGLEGVGHVATQAVEEGEERLLDGVEAR